MTNIKRYIFSLGFFFLTILIALYAFFLGNDILADGTVVETGRTMMPWLLISFICLVISIIVESFRIKKGRTLN